MKLAIIPSHLEWLIAVNPAEEVTPREITGPVMSWMYTPWPDAAEKGVIEIEAAGDTLRELLMALSERYTQAGVDCNIINSETQELDSDYDVFINGVHLSALPAGLETSLQNDDEVKVRFLFRWDG
jgi:hypothetical protein